MHKEMLILWRKILLTYAVEDSVFSDLLLAGNQQLCLL